VREDDTCDNEDCLSLYKFVVPGTRAVWLFTVVMLFNAGSMKASSIQCLVDRVIGLVLCVPSVL